MREGEPKNEQNGQKYLKHTGDESLPIEIIPKGKIGEGNFGDVFSVEMQKMNKRSEIKKRKFAVKSFCHADEAKRALDNYSELKKRGLKTFPTYRLNKDDEKSILMTYGNKADSFLVSARDQSNAGIFLQRNPIIKIDNFEQLVVDIIEHAKLAADEKMILPYDSYFFIVATNQPNTKKLDFLIGDLDLVKLYERFDKKVDIQECNKVNIDNAHCALRDFIHLYVQEDKKQEYFNLLKSPFEEAGFKAGS